ncbi:hypothetical protein RhiirA4_479614 [Rhizophagus irregularis]|uniref:Protein kinase domain-containing protein n=1 Tax=Rhizophagus irregularis TaxID=588596 RepID=A0A2I1HGP9_9GLOM|nr:hypothetical protein RhiirA4_479614 [Rhizophagus irregularis]
MSVNQITYPVADEANIQYEELVLRLEECSANRLKILLDDETSQVIYCYDPQDFTILSKISFGASTLVYDVYWRSTSKYAIKKFVRNSEEDIIKEIHLTGLVNLHPNIIQFYGVTKLKGKIIQ